MNGRPDFTMSDQTLAIVNALRGVNQEISYAALSGMIGFEVSGATASLSSARRHLESKERIVFTIIRGEGLRRLDDSGKVHSTARHIRAIGRAARRGQKRIATVENFAALTNGDQLKATLVATQLEFAQQAVSSKKITAPMVDGRLDVKALVAAAMGKKK